MDSLLPNIDTVNQATFTPNATDATSITMLNGGRFQVGDLVRPSNGPEVMQVTAVAGNVLTVVRRIGNTTGVALANGMRVAILGNAALEGADAPSARFTSRVRKANYTQIFTATVDVTGTMRAVRAHGLQDELDFQKQERLRELLRDLENCVINGAAPASSPQGSTTVRRSMNGIVKSIATNAFTPNQNGFPAGGGAGQNELNEAVLNAGLRQVWEQSSGGVDTIVVNGAQKRRINQFVGAAQRFWSPQDSRFKDSIGIYESDFGVCKVVLSRWVPLDTVLLLSSARVQVTPLQGRSFHFKPLAATGDSVTGQVIGEYTLEFRNESAHGLIRGLATT